MKKINVIIRVVLLVCSLLFVMGCNRSDNEKVLENYQFESIDDEEELYGTSQIKNIIEGFPAAYNEQCVRIQGSILGLFGDPLYETIDLENQYAYVIKATDEKDEVSYLSLYHGPSGPAIGGMRDDVKSERAADALIRLILTVDPVDFTYDGYYPDGPNKISMGIENGKVFYSETHMTDPAEIAEMYRQLGYDSY